MPDARNYRVGPHPGYPFKFLMHQPTEEYPSQGGPSVCLMCQTTVKDPGKGALYVPELVELQRKTIQRGLLIASYQRVKENKKRL